MSNTTRLTRVQLDNEAPAPPSHEIDLRSEQIVKQPTTPLPADQTGIRTVRVFDPQRQGSNNVLYYAVESKRVSSNGSVRHDCVRRRFSDFVWLRQELQRSFPGCVIPFLPTKSVLGTMQSNFIEKRQRGLNLFMERIISHPRLRHCASLDVFLSAQNSDLELAKQERTAQEPTLGLASSGLINFFSQKFQSVQESILGPGAALVKNDTDLKFERMAETVSQSLTLANNCLSAYQGLAASHKESAQWWASFGLSLTVLSDHEHKQEHNDCSIFVNEIGLSADRTSVLVSHHLDREYSGFKQPLRDLIDQLRSVEEALQARLNAQGALQQATLDVKSKQAKLDQLRKRGLASEKVSEAQEELSRAEQIRSELASMLQRVTEEVQRDFEQFQSEKQTVLKRLAQSFAQIQISHCQKVIASWQSAIAAMSSRQ